MWKKVRIILALYLAVNIIAGIVFWPRIDQFLRFMPRVEPAKFSQATTPGEAQQQDLSYLKSVLDYDRSFNVDERKKFLSRISELQTHDKKMTEAELYLALRELMALADNGHSSVSVSPAFQSFNRSGVDFYQFSDGYYVARAHIDNKALLGKKIIAIDDQAIDEIVSELRKYTGGPNIWRDLQSLYILRSPELLNAAGITNNKSMVRLTYLDETGAAKNIQLTAMPPAGDIDYYRHAFMTLSPNALGDEGDEWVRSLDTTQGQIAPYLSNLSKSVSAQPVNGGIYIQSNYLMETPTQPVKDMLLEYVKEAPSSGYDFIVVDLRWNPGGDYGNAKPFAKDVGSALSKDGKVYVITGPSTFSAAIVFSALIKQSLPDQAIIIGENMGDHPQFWSERGKAFILPNSGYWINYSTAYHDWEKGCAKTHKYCFPPNKRAEKNIGSLALDKIIQPSYQQYASGQDIVMEWVLNDFQSNP